GRARGPAARRACTSPAPAGAARLSVWARARLLLPLDPLEPGVRGVRERVAGAEARAADAAVLRPAGAHGRAVATARPVRAARARRDGARRVARGAEHRLVRVRGTDPAPADARAPAGRRLAAPF